MFFAMTKGISSHIRGKLLNVLPAKKSSQSTKIAKKRSCEAATPADALSTWRTHVPELPTTQPTNAPTARKHNSAAPHLRICQPSPQAAAGERLIEQVHFVAGADACTCNFVAPLLDYLS